MDVDRGDGNSKSSTGIPASRDSPQTAMIPVPDSPPLSAQLPPHQTSTPNLRPSDSAFDRAREPPQAPTVNGAQFGKVSWGQLRDQCSQRGYWKKDSKAVLKTRLPTLGAAEAKRN